MESIPTTPEQGPEQQAPSSEDIARCWQQLINPESFHSRTEENILVLEDGQTPYHWSFVIGAPDETSQEFTYALKGDFSNLPGAPKNAKSGKTAIYVAYLDSDGMPTGGKHVAGIPDGPDSSLTIF